MCGLCETYNDPEGEFERACDDRDKYKSELDKFSPIAWETSQGLVVRIDYKQRVTGWRGLVDLGRAIPDAWLPAMFTRGE